MVFSDVCADVLDYIARPSSEMLTSVKREVNNTILWAQRKRAFSLAERLIDITYPTGQIAVDISSACDGTPRDYQSIQLMSTSGGSGYGNLLYLRTFNSIMQELFKYQRRNTRDEFEEVPVNDPVTYANYVQIHHQYYAFIVGHKLGLYPMPTTDVPLRVNLHVFLPRLVSDADTNFFLDQAYDFVILKTILRMSILFKTETRYPVDEKEVVDAWDSVCEWDSSMVSSPGPSQ